MPSKKSNKKKKRPNKGKPVVAAPGQAVEAFAVANAPGSADDAGNITPLKINEGCSRSSEKTRAIENTTKRSSDREMKTVFDITDSESEPDISMMPETMEDVLYYLEQGVDLVTMVEGILRTGVMGGLHSIDVSLIIAPAIHEFIKVTADEVGLDYEEGFEDKEGKKRKTYARNVLRAKDMLKKVKVEMPVEVEEEPEVVIEDFEETEPKPKGLMARRL
jgi:hypothetical protein